MIVWNDYTADIVNKEIKQLDKDISRCLSLGQIHSARWLQDKQKRLQNNVRDYEARNKS